MEVSKIELLNYKIKIIKKEDSLFPKRFLDLEDCPKEIYIIGNEELLNNFSISIVGTRNASPMGKSIAFELSKNLSKYATIVSGMATGIDYNAHLGAIINKNTVGIIAGGFKSGLIGNKMSLAKNILDNNGLIISEYQLDMPPQKHLFLERNRLIAALSEATIIVEAGIKSGSLNTAKHAQILNREIFCIPWNIDYEYGKGTINLLKNGAKCINNYKDILDYFNKNIQTSIEEYKPFVDQKFKFLYEIISKERGIYLEKILTLLPNFDISNILYLLTLMELNGLIYTENNMYYIKK